MYGSLLSVISAVRDSVLTGAIVRIPHPRFRIKSLIFLTDTFFVYIRMRKMCFSGLETITF